MCTDLDHYDHIFSKNGRTATDLRASGHARACKISTDAPPFLLTAPAPSTFRVFKTQGKWKNVCKKDKKKKELEKRAKAAAADMPSAYFC